MPLRDLFPSRLFLAGAALSALVLSSCSPSPTRSSLLGEESEPAARPPVKVVATPNDPDPVETEESEPSAEAPAPPRIPGPWVPPAPTQDPWNPFRIPGMPSWPAETTPRAREPSPRPERKAEPKPEQRPPAANPVAPIPPSPQPSGNPAAPWDPLNIFRPSTPAAPTKAEPEKRDPPTSPKPTTGTTWPKVTPPSPKPVAPAPAKPTAPEDAPETKSTGHPLDLLKIMTRAYAQSIGVYDRGSLARADQLPESGDGFLKVFQERDRAYGALDLITLITEASREIRREIPAVERVQVGDISDRNGGRLGGHGSHQNGLDADLTYFRKDRAEMPVVGSRPGSTGFGAGFVAKGRVLPVFDTEANWKFIQLLDATGRLDRIFVDQRIKKEFCGFAVAKGMRGEWKETLRKLRHWPYHADHMHVRITCPKNSKACKPIPTIPAGDGCDALLDRGGIVRTGGAAYLDAGDEAMGEVSDEGHPDDHGC